MSQRDLVTEVYAISPAHTCSWVEEEQQIQTNKRSAEASGTAKPAFRKLVCTTAAFCAYCLDALLALQLAGSSVTLRYRLTTTSLRQSPRCDRHLAYTSYLSKRTVSQALTIRKRRSRSSRQARLGQQAQHDRRCIFGRLAAAAVVRLEGCVARSGSLSWWLV